jgi:hypothetical protein
MSLNVFLSVGRTATPEQRRFVATLQDFLVAQGLSPRTVGRTDFTDQKPLKRIADVLRECSGTIVVATERRHIADGMELRGGSEARALRNVKLPTVWNQIEAAIAYTLGHPLLAIVEAGLRDEGMLAEGYDWYVKWIDLSPQSLGEPEFLKLFAEWKRNVEKYRREQDARTTS